MNTTETFFMILRTINIFVLSTARSLEWLIKFILYSILYSIGILEAVVLLLLQLLKIIKDAIKVLFSCGTLLYHIGYGIGGLGTLFLVLSLCTYVLKFKATFFEGQISNTVLGIVNKVLITLWISVVPIALFLGYVKLKRTMQKTVKQITAVEVDADDYMDCVCGKTRIRYFNKSTETDGDHSIEGHPRTEAGSSHDDEAGRRKRQNQKGTRTPKDDGKDSSKEGISKGKGRGLVRRDETASDDDSNDSSDQEGRGAGRGLGRGRGQGRGRGRGRGRV